MENKDALIELQGRVESALKEAKDPEYAKYLSELLRRVEREKIKVNSLYREFYENDAIYKKRMEAIADKAAEPVSVVQPVKTEQSAYVQQPIPVMPAQPKVRPQKKKSTMEFKVGAWLFSVIGVLFILAAFVLLGMTYMNGMVKGLGLYLISLIVLLVSELILAKKMEKFSLGITGLGICSLYMSTIINYLYLENFNGIVAMILTVVVTLIAIFISRRKDSAIIKIISFIGCYICFFPIDGFADDVNFLIITGILLIVNLVTVFLPVKRVQYSVNIIHMISNVIFTCMMLAIGNDSDISGICLILYSLCSIWIQNVIYLLQDKYIASLENEKKVRSYQTGNIWVYCVNFLIQIICFATTTEFVDSEYPIVHIAMAIAAVMTLIVFVLQKSSKIKWIQYWAFNILVFIVYGWLGDGDWEVVISTLALFVLAKLLGRVRILRVSELIITSLTAMIGLYYFICEGVEGLLFLAAFLLSVLMLYHWKSLYESIITFMVCIFAVCYLPSADVIIPVCVGVLLLGILGFANVKFFKGRCNQIYNIISLAAMIVLYLIAAFTDNKITYVCLLIFGITTIVMVLQKRYGLACKGKALILSIFLTYMAFIFKVDLPIAISILLMLVSIISVISGFVIKKKSQRIYGLVLSLFVCLKIALFDFNGIETIQKMILFMVAGVVILAISGIYILLEKKVNE